MLGFHVRRRRLFRDSTDPVLLDSPAWRLVARLPHLSAATWRALDAAGPRAAAAIDAWRESISDEEDLEVLALGWWLARFEVAVGVEVADIARQRASTDALDSVLGLVLCFGGWKRPLPPSVFAVLSQPLDRVAWSDA